MRLGLLAAVALLVTSMTAIAADPPIVFQTQPVGRMLNDVRSVVKMVGGEKAVAEFNDGIKTKLGEKGFEGQPSQHAFFASSTRRAVE